MRITGAGNVGIGTTGPQATLDVAATKTTLADAWTPEKRGRFY